MGRVSRYFTMTGGKEENNTEKKKIISVVILVGLVCVVGRVSRVGTN